MSTSPARKTRVLFLHTGAGGGHTSAAKAIIEALQLRYGQAVSCEMIDVLKDYAPRPLGRVPEAYTQMLRAPQLYRQVYEIGDGQRRSKFLTRSITLYTRRAAAAILEQHPADVIVSTFHFANAPVLDGLERHGYPTPFINVVTDLVTIPPVWFDDRADYCVVPTEPAYHQAIIAGMPTERLFRIGLPVSPRLVAVHDKIAVRKKLGWPVDKPIALIMAGGAGVGPLGALGSAIVAANIGVIPVILAGKNRRLAARLRQAPWANQAMIYDFVEEMPTLMQAADVLITKAGPGTITEALNVHLPMILYSRVPGQEEGNVEYVTHTGAGYWTPKRQDMVKTLQYLIGDPKALQRASLAASRLSNPKAADQIGQLVMRAAEKHRQK